MEAEESSIAPFVIAHDSQEWSAWCNSIPIEQRVTAIKHVKTLFQARHGIAGDNAIMLQSHLQVSSYVVRGMKSPADREFETAFNTYTRTCKIPESWKRNQPAPVNSFGQRNNNQPRLPLVMLGEEIKQVDKISRHVFQCAEEDEWTIWIEKKSKELLYPGWTAEEALKDAKKMYHSLTQIYKEEYKSEFMWPLFDGIRFTYPHKVEAVLDVPTVVLLVQEYNDSHSEATHPHPVSGQCAPLVLLKSKDWAHKMNEKPTGYYQPRVHQMLRLCFEWKFGIIPLGNRVWLEDQYEIQPDGSLKYDSATADWTFLNEWNVLLKTGMMQGPSDVHPGTHFQGSRYDLPFTVALPTQQEMWLSSLELARHFDGQIEKKCIRRCFDLVAERESERRGYNWLETWHAIPTKDLQMLPNGNLETQHPTAKRFVKEYNKLYAVAWRLLPDMILGGKKEVAKDWTENPTSTTCPNNNNIETSFYRGHLPGEELTYTNRDVKESAAVEALLKAAKALEEDRRFLFDQSQKLNEDWKRCYSGLERLEERNRKQGDDEQKIKTALMDIQYREQQLRAWQDSINVEIATQKAEVEETLKRREKELEHEFTVKEQKYLLGIREYEVLKRQTTLDSEECKKRGDKLKRELERVRKLKEKTKHQKAEEKEGTECVVCMDEAQTFACVPCGHLCLCQNCRKIDKCPMCRREVKSTIQIYPS